MMFWKKKYVPDDERLLKVINILYPPLEVARTPDGTKYHIDYSIDSNLDAVLLDLQEGNNDAACQKTLESCIRKLNEVRRILEAYAVMDDDAKYLVVDNGQAEDELDYIQVQK